MKKPFTKVLSASCAAVIVMAAVTGCGNSASTQADGVNNETVVSESAASDEAGKQDTSAEETTPAADVKEETKSTDLGIEAPYFVAGVYLNYPVDDENAPMDNFYVFTSETTGAIENGSTGEGVPFACEQADGTVKFLLGGMEDLGEKILTVDSVENRAVTGHFDDGVKLVFVPELNVDPAGFDAVNYLLESSGEDLVYSDANGWSVRYDPKCIEVNGGGPVTTFVYTGESAGTNMITATYDVDKDAKTAIEDLSKSYGENAKLSEGPFPGAESVNGYWVSVLSSGDDSGLYMTAVARDYLDGYILFELTGHNSGDDAIDIPVSDALSAIIDSLSFE